MKRFEEDERLREPAGPGPPPRPTLARLQRGVGNRGFSALLQRQSGTTHMPRVGDLATPSPADRARVEALNARERQRSQEAAFEGNYKGIITQSQLVYRGDSRDPSEIFQIGFSARRFSHYFKTGKELNELVTGMAESLAEDEPEMSKQKAKQAAADRVMGLGPPINVSGEKVQYGVSTSRDQGIVRRKYGHGRWIYACVFPYGYDMEAARVNKLEEVSGFFVPPQFIIAAIGPIVETADEDYFATELVVNPACVVPKPVADAAVQQLESNITIQRPKGSRPREAPT